MRAQCLRQDVHNFALRPAVVVRRRRAQMRTIARWYVNLRLAAAAVLRAAYFA